MSIVQCPEELQISEPLNCAICRVKLLLTKATAGLHDADNHQAFACVSHFSEVELLIVGWADFIIRERHKAKRKSDVGVGNAWLNP
jgi:hypothetical protein